TSKVQFHGIGDARDNRFYPSHLSGLVVEKRVGRLHVLHGANMSESTGKPIAAIRLNYADGHAHTMFVEYGVHTRDWWKHPDEKESSLSDTNSSLVWTGASADATKIGATHRLFKTTFDLPPSAHAVQSIDVFSLFSRSAFVLLGLTVEAPDPGRATPVVPATPSADLAKLRDQLVCEVTASGGGLVGGARIKGTSLDDRGMGTLLGRMDDGGEDPGVVMVDFPANTRSLRLIATARNRGPQVIELRAGPDGHMPRKASVQLGMSKRVYGLVLKPDGQPLAKAKVDILEIIHPSTGALMEIKLDEVTTDADGVWKAQLVPESVSRLVFRLIHADYWPGRFEVSETEASDTITGEKLLSGDAQFRMRPKVTISGLVKDPSGQLLPKTQVSLTHGNGSAGTRTDLKGHFTISRRDVGEAFLIVEHPDFATYISEIPLTNAPRNVAVTLLPPKPFRGRLVEARESGAAGTPAVPISGAMVSIVSAKTSRARWSGKTDSDGRFSWPQAPDDEVNVETRQGNFISRTFPRVRASNEIEFALAKNFIAWGTAVDAATKAPIPEFSLVLGQKLSSERMLWRTAQSSKGRDGVFSFNDTSRGYFPNQALVKVEAPGYQPQVFRADDLGWHSNRIELRAAADIRGSVKLPDGKPAAGADIAVIGDGHVSLNNNALSGPGLSGERGLIVKSDAAGTFTVGPRLTERVVIVHSEGYAETTLSSLATHPEVTLQRWGQIEGVVRSGTSVVPRAEVRLNEPGGNEGLAFATGYMVTADVEGRFRFPRVPPGPCWLTRHVRVRQSFGTMAYGTAIDVEPGKTATTIIGGTGRPVIGKVVADDPSRKIPWTNASHTMSAILPRSPVIQTPAEFQKWSDSPAGRVTRQAPRSFPIYFEADGSFRTEDVPPGRYQLSFYFYEPRDSGVSSGIVTPVGSVVHSFEVGPIPGGRSDEPLDLGSLELKTRRVVGSAAPSGQPAISRPD
ncbi:MAG: hypothetical protein QOF48_2965, partial [Verrucomicrobiota bacterium]